MYTEVEIENKKGGAVNFVHFPGSGLKGQIGIQPNQTLVNGHDVFEEADFINALWDLYPDGLPERPEILSKEQRVALHLLNMTRGEGRTYTSYAQAEDSVPLALNEALREARAIIDLLDGNEG